MPEKIYSFNGKDITMNICIQIRGCGEITTGTFFHIAFEEAVLLFINRRHIRHYRRQKTVYGLSQRNI